MLQNIINKNLVSVRPSANLLEVAQLMKRKNVGSVLVQDSDDKPIGIITDRDIVVRCVSDGKIASDCLVGDLMTEQPTTCKLDDGIYDCISKMRDAKVRRMPVVDNTGRAVGILSFGDLLAVLSRELADLTRSTTILEEFEDEAKAA